MINKIHLNRVACFKKSAILETDKKVNLIYGLNGTGKSTFSNFLYKSADTKYKDCSIESTDQADMLVYNQTFIQEQFFESEDLKGIFTLSKTNKDAELKIRNAEAEIKRLESEIGKKNEQLNKTKAILDAKQLAAKNKIWEIKTSFSGGDRVLEFCLEGLKSDGNKLLSYVESLKKPIEKPSKTINEVKNEVQSLSGENAQKYGKFSVIVFNGHETEKSDLLKKQIVGNDNSSIGEFINRLGNSDWVKNGLKYLPSEITTTKEACPFCQEKTISQELYFDIKNYFDESYEKDLDSLKNANNIYIEAIKAIPEKNTYESNPKFELYKKDFEISYSKLFNIFSTNTNLLSQKISSPSVSIALESSIEIIEELNKIIRNINSETDIHNKKIDNKVITLNSIKLLFWEIMRWEYDQTISPYIADKQNLGADIISIDKEIASLNNSIQFQRNIIIEQQKETVNIDESIANINNGLIDIGIDEFKIVKHSDVLYRIARFDTNSKIFHSLSEGEKMIISFLYFIELCRGKRVATDAANKKIIVIDDPISSLSHIYIFNVGRLIHNEFLRSDKYEQLFILTHSLYFFYELTDTNRDRRKDTQKLFRIRKNSEGSEILEMKYEEIQNDYHSYWFIVKDDKQPPALIANCMRNIIEYFFNFVEKKDLNVVFGKQELQNNRFSAFNRYVNRESHSLGQNIFDIKEFNYSDFKDAFKLVFMVTGYEDHYNKMAK